MPEWINTWICGHLARFLRMHIPGKEEDEEDGDKKSKNNMNDFNDMTGKSLLANVLDIDDDFGILTKSKRNKKAELILKKDNSVSYCDNCNDNSYGLSKSDASCRKLISNILKELQVLTKKIQDDAEDEEKRYKDTSILIF